LSAFLILYFNLNEWEKRKVELCGSLIDGNSFRLNYVNSRISVIFCPYFHFLSVLSDSYLNGGWVYRKLRFLSSSKLDIKVLNELVRLSPSILNIYCLAQCGDWNLITKISNVYRTNIGSSALRSFLNIFAGEGDILLSICLREEYWLSIKVSGLVCHHIRRLEIYSIEKCIVDCIWLIQINWWTVIYLENVI
jgi:hypothetical protein